MSEKIPNEQVMESIKAEINYIAEEAYQKGIQEGEGRKRRRHDHDEQLIEQGRNEAWEAARKIISMPDPPYWGIFGDYKNDLFGKITAREALSKLEAYEKKKADSEIKVGEELENGVSTVIVTHINLENGTFDGVGVNDIGRLGTYTGRPLKDWRKNGISHETYANAHQYDSELKGGDA